VAAAILAAVEGGILPPGIVTLNAEVTAKPAGWPALRQAGRPPLCYVKQIPFPDQRSDFGVDNRFDNGADGQ